MMLAFIIALGVLAILGFFLVGGHDLEARRAANREVWNQIMREDQARDEIEWAVAKATMTQEEIWDWSTKRLTPSPEEEAARRAAVLKRYEEIAGHPFVDLYPERRKV